MAAEPAGAAGEPPRSLRVLIVDDHDVVHWGFRLMLGQQSWVERTSQRADGIGGRGARRALRAARGAGRSVRRRRVGPEIADAPAGARDGPADAAYLGAGRISPSAASAAGAPGFVQKDWPARDIADAVQRVGRGQTVFPPQPAPAPKALTAREREVLELIASGATNREIADSLLLSPNTVKEHTSSLYRKLDVRNRAEAVQRAQRLGLLA